MRLIRGLSNIQPHHRQPILTIGNFDGVHVGHQAMLKTLLQVAATAKHASMVMTFEPSPAEFFHAAEPPARLTRLAEKARLIASHDIDYLLTLNFNHRFSQLTAEAFIEHILIRQLDVKHVMVGEDFRFGHQRRGDVALLQQASDIHGFGLTTFPAITVDQIRVSSSHIRQALRADDLSRAKHLLGRRYSMSGRVVHGEKQGRLLGVPTANILPKRRHCPVAGIYIALTHGVTAEALPAVVHIGKQPTVGGQRELLEVHLLNFTGDLYGRHLTVEFMQKIRDIQQFECLDALSKAMHQDIQIAKNYFQLTE